MFTRRQFLTTTAAIGGSLIAPRGLIASKTLIKERKSNLLDCFTTLTVKKENIIDYGIPFVKICSSLTGIPVNISYYRKASNQATAIPVISNKDYFAIPLFQKNLMGRSLEEEAYDLIINSMENMNIFDPFRNIPTEFTHCIHHPSLKILDKGNLKHIPYREVEENQNIFVNKNKLIYIDFPDEDKMGLASIDCNYIVETVHTTFSIANRDI